MKKIVYKVFLSVFLVIAVQSQSQTRIWSEDILKKGKNSFSDATNKIFKEADKALSTTIMTVMDKETVPPSGDKHDYISAGRYWWPDPKNPGGPYIRKDGVVNREIDKFDRSTLGSMAKSVTNLSLAYYFTSDEKYAAKAVQNLKTWFLNPSTKMNPNMNFGQIISGRNDGKGRGEGILDTYPFVEMLDGVELLKNSKSFTPAVAEGLKKWFSEYLNWMMTNEIGNEEYTAKNNHGTAFDVQATRYAFFIGNEYIASKFINEFSARRVFTQIEPDGKQPLELARTTALGYSTFNLTHMLDMCFMARSIHNNIYSSKAVIMDIFSARSDDGRSILKAAEFLSQFVDKPQSNFPYQQIKEWESVQKKLILQLYRVDKLTDKPVFENYYKKKITDSNKVDNLIFN